MDEIALRKAMVSGIRRSLFGPDSLESMIWPGSTKPATLIDSNFQPKESRPIGPWVHADGQEILDQLPHRIYGTGVLYSTNVVSIKDIPDAVMELDDDEDELSQPVSLEDAKDEVDDDEIVCAVDYLGALMFVAVGHRRRAVHRGLEDVCLPCGEHDGQRTYHKNTLDEAQPHQVISRPNCC